MKICLLYFFLFFSIKAFSSSYEIGQEIYLNACGPNPQEYFEKPLVLNNLSEVPNKITDLNKSEFEREFQTLATSHLTINDNLYTATLENFRYFKVTDVEGNILIDRKVSGATSIYEILFKGNVVAWGVGWHKEEKHCSDNIYYQGTDFTALRIFYPKIESNKNLSFYGENVLSASFSDNSFITKADRPIIIDKTTISGTAQVYNYYYSALNFYELTLQGLIEVKDEEDLIKFGVNVNNISPDIYLHWLSRHSSPLRVHEFIKTNYDEIIMNNMGDIVPNNKSKKDLCMNNEYLTHKQITQNCFPTLVDENGSNQYENLMNTNYIEIYETPNKKILFENIFREGIGVYSVSNKNQIEFIDYDFLNLNEVNDFRNLHLYDVSNSQFDVVYDDWGQTNNHLRAFTFKISKDFRTLSLVNDSCKLVLDSDYKVSEKVC